ncbi:hypothetical protein ACX80B_17465 [Arthrobacter monumenti]
MKSVRNGRLALFAVMLLSAAACGGPTEPASEHSATPSFPLAATPKAQEERHVPDSTPAPDPDATIGEADTADALNVATQAMTYYARPKLDAERWAEELSPLLTPKAAESYGYTNPANVPATEVTGEAAVVPPPEGVAPSPRVITIEVPTDAGAYKVVLSRQGNDSPWKVERINPPQNGP